MRKVTQAELDKMISDYERWLRAGEPVNSQIITPSFSNLDFSNLSFRHANLHRARFENSILTGCNFRRANLERVNFRKANLTKAILKEANLFRADLYGAILDNVRVDEYTKFFHPICPEEGSIIGYKKVNAGDRMFAIAKLFIPEDAKRNSATTYRCRADKATVMEIEREDGVKLQHAASCRERDFVYTVGETLQVDNFDQDRWHETSTGIHFFVSKEMAKLY